MLVRSAQANVAVLPFLEAGNAQADYDFHVRWDHENNLDMAANMPASYQCPSTPGAGDPGPEGFSTADYSYVRSASDWFAHLGTEHAMFEINKFRKFRDITDGLSNTLMQYESAGRVQSWVHGRVTRGPAWWDGSYRAWTGNFNASWFYPAELTVEPDSTVTVNWFVGSEIINSHNWNSPYSFHPGGIQISLADGSVRFLTENVNVDVINAVTSIDGHEVLKDF